MRYSMTASICRCRSTRMRSLSCRSSTAVRCARRRRRCSRRLGCSLHRAAGARRRARRADPRRAAHRSADPASAADRQGRAPAPAQARARLVDRRSVRCRVPPAATRSLRSASARCPAGRCAPASFRNLVAGDRVPAVRVVAPAQARRAAIVVGRRDDLDQPARSSRTRAASPAPRLTSTSWPSMPVGASTSQIGVVAHPCGRSRAPRAPAHAE